MTRAARPLDAIERRLFWLIAFACFAFALVTPPFQVPDEPQHLSRSVRLAHGEIGFERRGTAIGGRMAYRYTRLSGEHFPREAVGVPMRYRPADLARAAAAQPGDDAPIFIEFANVASYAPTLYVPQAIGILVGEILGVSSLACFYLARLANVVAFLALLWGAVRVLPFGRPVLLAVAALPTVAYQGASVSPDATINGLGWLVLALSLDVGFGAVRQATRKGLIAWSVPLGLCKGLYAPLALAGIRSRATALWCIAAFAAGAMAFVGWTLAAGGDQALYMVESRTTGQLVTTAPLGAQLAVVMHDPLRYVRVLASSMAERAPVYVLQLVGRFGWNAILQPLIAYPVAAVMLAAGVLAGLGGRVPVLARLWWLVVGITIVLLVETALYLTGTPLAAGYVQGTQGRYFLPVLPLIALALAPTRLRPRHWLLGSACLLQVVALVTVIDAFWIHGFTSQRGFPAFAHDPGGIARALLLPSPRW